jgi:VDE lipocalin domain
MQEEDSGRRIIGSVTFLIPSSVVEQNIPLKFGMKSPVGHPTLLEAVNQLARKSNWFADGMVETSILPVPDIITTTDDDDDSDSDETIQQHLCSTNVLLAIGLSSKRDLETAAHIFSLRRLQEKPQRHRQCQFALDCATVAGEILLPSFVGPYDHSNPSVSARLLPWTLDATGRRLHEQMSSSFAKWSSCDDFAFAIMIFLNQFSGYEVDWVKHSIDATWEKGPLLNAQEFYAMITKCGDCITDCVRDAKCSECLGKLQALDTRDQVASYRTIVSYESDLLRDFSFCILQKNNIFNCNAKIPFLPKVEPIATFRGQPLTEELARSILVGHLDDETALDGSRRLPVSWKVACGANEAYDKVR